MQPRDIIDAVGLLFAGFIAWQNMSIRAALAELETKLVNRIAANEADVRVLQSQVAGMSAEHLSHPRLLNGRG